MLLHSCYYRKYNICLLKWKDYMLSHLELHTVIMRKTAPFLNVAVKLTGCKRNIFPAIQQLQKIEVIQFNQTSKEGDSNLLNSVHFFLFAHLGWY